MAASSNTVASFGRITALGSVAVVKATITASATAYAAGSGGLPVDLTDILKAASPFSAPIHPDDVVGILPAGLSPNGVMVGALTKGTPTYTTLPGGAAARPNQTMATFPAWVRLYSGALAEASGNITDTITVLLMIARGGTNTN